MKPKACSQKNLQGELFQVESERLVTGEHPLVKVGRRIDWGRFEKQMSPLYCEGKGRPAIATRLILGCTQFAKGTLLLLLRILLSPRPGLGRIYLPAAA